MTDLYEGKPVAMADIPALIAQWIREKRGDVCFLRPDQWRLPSESEMAVAVGNAVREKRRVRAIYPARAMSGAPHMLRMRAEIGRMELWRVAVQPGKPFAFGVVEAARRLFRPAPDRGARSRLRGRADRPLPAR